MFVFFLSLLDIYAIIADLFVNYLHRNTNNILAVCKARPFSKICLLYFKDDPSPDILQWAPVNVISEEDCQDDWFGMGEEQICIRDPNGEFGACFVSTQYQEVILGRAQMVCVYAKTC